DILLDSRSLSHQLFSMYKGDLEWEKGRALFVSMDCRDPATADHSLIVGFIAYHLVKSIRVTSRDADRMFLVGFLHDIGKLTMPDDILKSSKRLSPEERDLIIDHVQIGYNALNELEFGPDILQFCFNHHERLDGSGYPLGSSDHSEIGRIAAISDIYSTLKLPRSYRADSFTDEGIIEFLYQNKGQFDKEYTGILKAFLHNRSSLPTRSRIPFIGIAK
ncbi:HDIG domain-containing protein, partial [Paenibacillus sp. yr247]|uniref:HD-GYP domain-containing protein n=1 Tax=Paenibacillus sp. yr247 TaxID=1761880 RepID=UPI000887DA8F